MPWTCPQTISSTNLHRPLLELYLLRFLTKHLLELPQHSGYHPCPASRFSPKHLYACMKGPGTALPLSNSESATAPSTHLGILRQCQGPRTAQASSFCPNASTGAGCSCSNPGLPRPEPAAPNWCPQASTPAVTAHRPSHLVPLLLHGTPTHMQTHTQRLHPGPGLPASLGVVCSSSS